MPGEYGVSLQVGDTELKQSFRLVKDATSDATQEDLQRQFDLHLQIYQTYSEATWRINELRRIRSQLMSLAERLGVNEDTADLAKQASALNDSVLDIEKGIFIPDLPEGWPGRLNQGTDPLRRLSGLPSVVGLGEFPPTEQAYAVFHKLSGMIKAQIAAFDALQENDIADFNRGLAERGVTALG